VPHIYVEKIQYNERVIVIFHPTADTNEETALIFLESTSCSASAVSHCSTGR